MNHPSTYHLIVGTNQLLDLLFLSNPVISNSFTLHMYLLHYYLAMMPFLTKGKIGGGGHTCQEEQQQTAAIPVALSSARRGPCGIMAMRLRRTFHPPPTPRAATRDTVHHPRSRLSMRAWGGRRRPRRGGPSHCESSPTTNAAKGGQ